MRHSILLAATVSILASISAPALAVPVQAEHYGTWGPLKSPCDGEPRVEIQKNSLRLFHKGKVETYGNLEENLTCWSGATLDSISSCVNVEFGHKGPGFMITMNPDEKPNLARFEAPNGKKDKVYPYQDLMLKRCAR